MFELERRVNYVKELIANDVSKPQDDDFIDYINDIFKQWYKPIVSDCWYTSIETNNESTNGANDKNKYKMFLLNGIYKLIFTSKRDLLNISVFSVNFYEYLLSNYPKCVDWFANHIGTSDDYIDEINKCVNDYMTTIKDFKHDINILRPILDNPLLTMSAIIMLNILMNTFCYRQWTYTEYSNTYLKSILIYFLIVSKYGVGVFSERIVDLFKIPISFYINVNTIYDFLCGKFDVNIGWNINTAQHIRNISLDDFRLYETLLITDMFTEDFNSFSKHLHEYIKYVLRYEPNKKLMDNVNTFFTSFAYCSKPVYINIFDIIARAGIHIKDVLDSSVIEYVNAIRNML